MNINDLWIVSVTVLNMCCIVDCDTISKDFYFTEGQKAIECFNYYKDRKNVCGLSIDRFIDTIQVNLDYMSKENEV